MYRSRGHVTQQCSRPKTKLNLMVTIPQHGKAGELHDMRTFLADVDQFFVIEAWRVQVEECLGEGASSIEKRSGADATMSDREFRAAYEGIYQTIDGSFVGMQGGVQKCSLLAVDSTCWEISGSVEFERHMVSRYGSWPTTR